MKTGIISSDVRDYGPKAGLFLIWEGLKLGQKLFGV